MKTYLNIITILFLFATFLVSQSINESQLDKLRNYVGAVNSNNQTVETKEERILETSDQFYYVDSIRLIEETEQINNQKKELQFFGYEYFSKSVESVIATNLPPPKEYILGIGDEIVIEIWGDTQFRQKYLVDKYGSIYVDRIGKVNVLSLNIVELENKLLEKFQNVYSSLKGKLPSAFLDVTIGELKSINITFLGETNIPGVHSIHPFSSIVSALIQTGGVLNTGSLRNIKLIRSGKTFHVFDLYQYLLSGKVDQNLRLLDGDVIFIPIRNSVVTIDGEIFKSAKYELKKNETIEDLINYSGGLTHMAFSNIRINRISLNRNKPNNETIIIDIPSDNKFVLQTGDDVFVHKKHVTKNLIYIYGQVKRPGEYAYPTSSKIYLLDVLELAGGVNDTTFMKSVYLKEGEIIRNNPNYSFPEIIKFNLHSLLNGDPADNIILQNSDIILIRENPKFTPPAKVIISGEVKVPGVYTLQKRWEELDDILVRAGGFNEKAYIDGLKLFRDGNQIVLRDYNISLTDGDSIYVPQPAGVVEIMGAVNRPGLIQYERGKSLDDYVRSAGGYSLLADENNITIVAANGFVTTKNRYWKTKINNGATIIVNEKEYPDPFDLTEFLKEISSILASLSTIIFIVLSGIN